MSLSPGSALLAFLTLAEICADASAFALHPHLGPREVIAMRSISGANSACACRLRRASPVALSRTMRGQRAEGSVAAAAAADADHDLADDDTDEDVDIQAAVDGELARLNALLSAGGEDAQRLSKALALVEKGAGAAPKAGKLEKAIKKKSGAFSSLVEFCVEDGTKQELEDVSRACRMGKAAALVVDVGFSLGGRERDTALIVLAEQAMSKGNFPGPCPVVLRHCALVDPLQVAEVSALGVSALMLPSAALSYKGPEVLAAAGVLGVEVAIEVDDAKSLTAALEAGARILCVRGVGSLEEALDLRKGIPSDVAALVAIPAQQVVSLRVFITALTHFVVRR